MIFGQPLMQYIFFLGGKNVVSYNKKSPIIEFYIPINLSQMKLVKLWTVK